MKKKPVNKKATEPDPEKSLKKEDQLMENELTEAISIEEFIRIRKLQNKILEKMLEKINQNEKKIKKDKNN
jgi:hypothetical protein